MFKFENVEKTYKGNISALNGVSFEVSDGEFFFIIGPSGAGKSTIIRLLIRQEKPTKGSIIFDNLNVPQIPRRLLSYYRQKLGIVFQDLKLIPSKTIRENVRFALEIVNKPKNEIEDTVNYLLEIVGLQERGNLFPDDLSGGEKQRAAIARALANEPKLVIADEPTGNLDPKTAFEIIDILKTVNNLGTTVMVVTHDYDIVNSMKDTRVIKVENGLIVADEKGSGLNLKKNPLDISIGKTEKVDPTKDMVELLADEGIDIEEIEIRDEIEDDISDLNIKSTIKDKLTKVGIISIKNLLDLTDEDLQHKGFKDKEIERINEALMERLK